MYRHQGLRIDLQWLEQQEELNHLHHREFIISNIEQISVATDLFSNRSKGIFTSTLLVFVENDQISNIEHFDLFELRVCTEFCSHHIE